MKDKRIIAMLITSIVTFVASLSISLGIAFALADPVAAVGLTELTFDVNATPAVSQEVVFDPVDAFNEDILEAVLVHNYDSIQYANEFLPDNIKLLKVTVSNDAKTRINFRFKVSFEGNDGTAKHTQVTVFNADTTKVVSMKNGLIPQMVVEPESVGHYVIATYVSNQYDFLGEVTFGSSMTMKLGLTKYGS